MSLRVLPKIWSPQWKIIDFQQRSCQLDVQFAITAPGYKPELFCEFRSTHSHRAKHTTLHLLQEIQMLTFWEVCQKLDCKFHAFWCFSLICLFLKVCLCVCVLTVKWYMLNVVNLKCMKHEQNYSYLQFYNIVIMTVNIFPLKLRKLLFSLTFALPWNILRIFSSLCLLLPHLSFTLLSTLPSGSLLLIHCGFCCQGHQCLLSLIWMGHY